VPVKKHSVEEIIAKLREIEKLTDQGVSTPHRRNTWLRRTMSAQFRSRASQRHMV
jgi:hypothetical protein